MSSRAKVMVKAPTAREVDVIVETITPALAQRYMARNAINRPINEKTIHRYATALERGHWKLNGETIVFDWNGDLRNGQHRLEACIRANIAFDTLVVRGIDPSAFDTMDQGRKRTGGDVLALLGEGDYNVAAAALKAVVYWQRGRLQDVRGGGNAREGVSNTEIEEAYHAHPGIKHSIAPGKACKILRGGLGTFFHYAFSCQNPELADEFFTALTTGAKLDEGHPALLLRERLRDESRGNNRLSTDAKLALTIKAWHKFVAGERLKRLTWDPSREDFPPLPYVPPRQKVAATAS